MGYLLAQLLTCLLTCLPAGLTAESFKRLGLSPPRGVLLHGPPGCSKTMLARAAATGSKATFIPLSCAQVGLHTADVPSHR